MILLNSVLKLKSSKFLYNITKVNIISQIITLILILFTKYSFFYGQHILRQNNLDTIPT